TLRRPPDSTPFPYTTLFRSSDAPPNPGRSGTGTRDPLSSGSTRSHERLEAPRPWRRTITRAPYASRLWPITASVGKIRPHEYAEIGKHTSELQSLAYLVCRL